MTMSGTPGSDPDARYPSWVVNPWDGVYMDVLDYQWGVAAAFWREIDALAAAHDVKVAVEMHPHNLVFSPVTLERLVELTGATHVGAEMDPSHLMWQGMDVVACIRRLGPLVFHAAAKDAMITPGVDVRGVLDTSFTRVPADAPDKVPTGYGFWCNAWPENPAWRFVAVGVGHDVEYWTEFLRALAEIDPDMAVNIEHEDAAYSRLDGLALAAENLRARRRQDVARHPMIAVSVRKAARSGRFRAKSGDHGRERVLPGQQAAQVLDARVDVGHRALAAGLLGEDRVLLQHVPAVVVTPPQAPRRSRRSRRRPARPAGTCPPARPRCRTACRTAPAWPWPRRRP